MGDWKYQRYNKPNSQPTREDINIWLKLYRAILGQSKYTALKLAPPSTAVSANFIPNYHTSNPVEWEVVRTIKNSAIDHGRVKL